MPRVNLAPLTVLVEKLLSLLAFISSYWVIIAEVIAELVQVVKLIVKR